MRCIADDILETRSTLPLEDDELEANMGEDGGWCRYLMHQYNPRDEVHAGCRTV